MRSECVLCFRQPACDCAVPEGTDCSTFELKDLDRLEHRSFGPDPALALDAGDVAALRRWEGDEN